MPTFNRDKTGIVKLKITLIQKLIRYNKKCHLTQSNSIQSLKILPNPTSSNPWWIQSVSNSDPAGWKTAQNLVSSFSENH